MLERGLLPEFEPAVVDQVARTTDPVREADRSVKDLTALPWVSIDNDDSRDLDQLTACDEPKAGLTTVYVAVADVDVAVPQDSPVDQHARHNTTSVYTGALTFPMLPERLSTDLTSLNEGVDRLAIVTMLTLDLGGAVKSWDVQRARVHNKAKLAYPSVGAWLAGTGPAPAKIGAATGLGPQLRLQDRVAQTLRSQRMQHGALDLQTIEAHPVFDGETITDYRAEAQNRAKELIEDFMIAANGVTARFLQRGRVPSLRRVVRSPERWQRLRELAREHGGTLPQEPDSRALNAFLVERRRADPLRFPDLSLLVIKMMGAGEYIVEMPGQEPIGHFGLAVRDYTHSTAPNRRFPDLITQRQIKAALAGRRSPYGPTDLEELARQCTDQEDAANKVERQVRKSAAALLLEHRLGEHFDGVVTGANERGTWVRVFAPPVEGKIVQGEGGLEVGDKVRVTLLSTDVERGFIDFAASRR